MREPIDIVNLRPDIAGGATHIAFLLTKVNSNLTAKELSDQSNPEGGKKKKKKQALAFKKLLEEAPGFCSQHSQDSPPIIYTPAPRVHNPLLNSVSSMHAQDTHTHMPTRHSFEGSLEKKNACFYKKSKGLIYGTKTC